MKIFQELLARCLSIAVLALIATPALAQVSIFVDVAPPSLPVYEQPACPNDGYLWTPGYWAYGDYGYYWVPGTWVQPPESGLLWTPCYWRWSGNNYAFYPGYWGSEVGFYGGVNYGYGYGGDGYRGGRWQGGNFFYNTSVNNIGSANIRNRYADVSAINQAGNISYNGGAGGVQAQPSAQQRQFASARHIHATSVQVAHVRAASIDRGQLASINGGTPVTPAAATPNSYKRVAQQHSTTQPLTKQDSLKERQASSVKNTPVASLSPQINPEKQNPRASQNPAPTESRNVVTQSDNKPAVTKPQPPVYNTEPRPETAVPTQPRPDAVQPRYRPQTEAPPQPHPQVAQQPQPRPEAAAKTHSQPGAGAKPQGQSDKPQPN